MATVATGSVLLTPKFDNLEASLTKQLNGAWAGVSASASKAGAGASKAFGGSMIAQGGIIGAASAVTSKAFDVIADSMGSAISRVDTMANFPKVMANLGYSSDEAKDSIERMSRAIDGMPTTLSGITGMTQQLAPLCGGLDEATSISIAMNNALLAGGAGAADVSRAMQQYSQMLSKGKPELQDWKTLQEVMPGQLNQIAQALLGPTANSRDLYQALKDGSLSMDDFNGAMVRLNDEGVNGFASFAQQAKDATGGIGTAMENARNRVAKALQKIIEAVGQTNISGAINSITSQFDGIADAVVEVVGFVRDHFGEIAPIVGGAAAAFVGFKAAIGISGAVSALSGPMGLLAGSIRQVGFAQTVAGAVGKLGGALSGKLGGPVGIAVAAIAGLVGAFVVAYNTNEGFRNAVQQAWGQIQSLAAQVWPYIQHAIGIACQVIQGIVQTVWPVVEGIIMAVMTNVQVFVQTVWPIIQQTFTDACAVIGGIIQAVWPVVQAVVTTVMQGIQFIVQTVWPVVQAAFQAAGQAIQGVIDAVFPFIQTLIETVMNVISGVISTVLAVINGDWDGVWNGIKCVAQSIWDGIGNIIEAGINMAKGVIESVLGFIRGIWDNAWNGLKGFCADIWEGIKSGVSNGIQGVMDFIGELPGKITGFFSNAGSWLVEAGKSILNGLKRGLMSAFEGVKDFVGGIGDWIVSHKGPPTTTG